MSETWRYFIQDLPNSVTNSCTISIYLINIFLLFLPGWIFSRKIKNNQARMLFRSGLGAIALAPALTMEAGGMVLLVPASWGVIWGAVIYLLPGDTLGFYFYLSLASILVIGCGGAIVAEACRRMKR